jgi:hypothetical protein
MSLRAFHVLFITVSVVLAALVAAWAMGQYQLVHDRVYLIGSIAAALSGAALAMYANAFLRKTKGL